MPELPREIWMGRVRCELDGMRNLGALDELLGHLFESIQLKVSISPKRVNDFDRPMTHTNGNRKVDVRI